MNKNVRSYLIELARKKTDQTIYYQKLVDNCKLNLNLQDEPYHRTLLGEILGEISVFEHENNRPLLSSLVIRKGDNYEGDGFYKLAEELGFGKWTNLKKEGIFEIQQIKECIEFWQIDSNYHKFKDV